MVCVLDDKVEICMQVGGLLGQELPEPSIFVFFYQIKKNRSRFSRGKSAGHTETITFSPIRKSVEDRDTQIDSWCLRIDFSESILNLGKSILGIDSYFDSSRAYVVGNRKRQKIGRVFQNFFSQKVYLPEKLSAIFFHFFKILI